jgi:hypothetical protein
MARRLGLGSLAVLWLVGLIGAAPLIIGGEGNTPLNDPGWPDGAAALFNHKGRIAWWEGPPFGGGQWHSECRGDVKALNDVLAKFARLEIKTKRVVVHDGAGTSFWLSRGRDSAKAGSAQIDWSFMVWREENWQQLRGLPADLNPTDAKDTSPPSQIDIYTARLRWADIVFPEGLEVHDQRLVAHGFTDLDGTVVEGTVASADGQQPVAATVQLQRVEPLAAGGYAYPVLLETRADGAGRWVLTQVPEAWGRIVVSAPGYLPRVIGHEQFDGQPSWRSYACELARPAQVSGRVTDEAGAPLGDVQVQFADVVSEPGGRYDTPAETEAKSDADGAFRFDGLPIGRATIWVHKKGYVRPGVGMPIEAPAEHVQLTMIKSASARVTVDFQNSEKPEGYIVRITPEGGERTGSFGGSGNIDAANQLAFENVPPGRYTFSGRPNPGGDDEETEPVTVELKGGETSAITLKAKPRADR